MTKVIEVKAEHIRFDNGIVMYSNHESDCCESHYLSLEHLSITDFEGLEFDLSGDSFYKKIEGYGIELIPVNGHSVKIPGYGYNNGYYSTQLDLIIEYADKSIRTIDISECQTIQD